VFVEYVNDSQPVWSGVEKVSGETPVLGPQGCDPQLQSPRWRFCSRRVYTGGDSKSDSLNCKTIIAFYYWSGPWRRFSSRPKEERSFVEECIGHG
jgi:hypothetical protein